MKAGLPIAIGYLPIAITFGLLAKSRITNVISALMSFAVYAGPVNSSPYSCSLWGPSVGDHPDDVYHQSAPPAHVRRHIATVAGQVGKGLLAGLAFGITDETFSVAALQADETLPPAFLAGLNLIAFAPGISAPGEAYSLLPPCRQPSRPAWG